MLSGFIRQSDYRYTGKNIIKNLLFKRFIIATFEALKEFVSKKMINWKKAATLNRYYRISKFYEFLGLTAVKAIAVIGVFVLLFYLFDSYILDTREMFNAITSQFSTPSILLIFYLSETLFGLIPPEIFIAWCAKMSNPWTFLFAISSLSYLGGVTAYFIGKTLSKVTKIRIAIETKVAHHISKLRKWGGLFIIIGAMLPLPHSIVSMACGLINYDFKHYALWSLFRFLRFVIYAAVIFQVW